MLIGNLYQMCPRDKYVALQSPGFVVRSHCARYVLLITLLMRWGLSAAPDKVQVQPPGDKGSVTASGKYVRPEAAPPAPTATPVAPSAPVIERRPDGTVVIGLVTVNEKTRTVSIPAALNMVDGLLEYALVHVDGKVHESLFSTKASPLHVHLACLLLNLAPTPESPGPKKLMIEVEWQPNGPKRRAALESFIALAKDTHWGPRGGTLKNVGWLCIGSNLVSGAPSVEREGSIISLITDSTALINNPLLTNTDDQLHVPKPGMLPGLGFPVTINLRAVAETAVPTP